MDYLKIKEEYKKLEKVFCPYLGLNVNFNAKGLHHLMFKNNIRKRSEVEVLERAKYFVLARKIISITTTLQEKEMFPKTETLKETTKFAFIAITEDLKLKVVIKKDGLGNWYFFSLIPNFITSPKRDVKKEESKNPS